jgi:hypothetical protein
MVGTGEYPSVREATKAAVREVRLCEPRTAEQEIYQAGYRAYRSLYPAVKAALG